MVNAIEMRYIIPVSVLTVYVFLNLALRQGMLGGMLVYIVTPLCWLLVGFITLKVSSQKKIRPLRFQRHLKSSLITYSLLIAFTQITALIFAGIFTSFGKSPYQFTPPAIITNLFYFLGPLIGFELSRAYIIKSFSKRAPTLIVGLTALLYTTISLPLFGFTGLNEPLEITKFLGSTYLPLLAENLLASYLAYLSGPIPAITYRVPLHAFQWLSPILPNPPWSIKAFIAVMIPTMGFISVNHAVAPSFLKKVGKRFRPKKTSLRSWMGWMTVAIISVTLIWASVGLLGFNPTVIYSGSMRPSMDVGDIAITVKVPPNSIKTGDIIQFLQEGETIVHRVENIQYEGNSMYFTTKGDANNALETVYPEQIVGKLVLIIPKLGWASIAIKTLIGKIWTFFSVNIILAYATLATALAASIYKVHVYRSRPARKWRSLNRKRGWLRK